MLNGCRFPKMEFGGGLFFYFFVVKGRQRIVCVTRLSALGFVRSSLFLFFTLLHVFERGVVVIRSLFAP